MASNSSDVDVIGLERFNRTAHQAADELRDFTPANRAAVQLVLDNAQPPRVSGALADNGRVEADAESGTVVYDLVYAPVIHNGWAEHNIEAQPWLADAFDTSTPDITDTYADHLVDVLNHIDGA